MALPAERSGTRPTGSMRSGRGTVWPGVNLIEPLLAALQMLYKQSGRVLACSGMAISAQVKFGGKQSASVFRTYVSGRYTLIPPARARQM